MRSVKPSVTLDNRSEEGRARVVLDFRLTLGSTGSVTCVRVPVVRGPTVYED